MKERLVDFALLIALGIIGLAIVFTLVNLGRDRTPEAAASDSIQTAQTGTVETQTIETGPVETGPVETGPGEVGETPQVQPEVEVTAVDETAAETAAEAATEAATEPAELAGEAANEAVNEPVNEPVEAEPAAELATPVEVVPAFIDAADEDAGGVAGAATGGADEEGVTLVLEPLEGGALARIGFNFATGQEGACGVPLEPWRHVAVSRDLLAEYGCGAQVTVTLPEPINGREEVTATVADTMGPAAQRTVNVYVAPDEPAFDYGLLEGGEIAATASP